MEAVVLDGLHPHPRHDRHTCTLAFGYEQKHRKGNGELFVRCAVVLTGEMMRYTTLAEVKMQ